MANLFSPQGSKRIRVLTIGIVLFCFVLFLLNFYLNYHFGLARGNWLRSFVFAIPIPAFLAMGLLPFIVQNKTRQTTLPWYKDYSVLQRLWVWPLLLIYLPIIVNGLMNNGLPDAVFLPFGIGGILLMVFIYGNMILAWRTKKRLAKEKRSL